MPQATKAPAPWTYAPESDSDGFTIGTDHFVLDANGDEVCVAPDEVSGRRIAAVNELVSLVEEFLYLWPLSGYELEAYCDATLVPMMKAAMSKVKRG